MVTKHYFEQRMREAVQLSNSAKQLLKQIHAQEVALIREDMELLSREEEFLKEMESIDRELDTMLKDEVLLELVVSGRDVMAVKQRYDKLKEQIVRVRRRLETLRSKEHAVEEKRQSEAKEVEKEWTKLTQLEKLIQSLRDLEERIASIIEHRGMMPKALKKEIKL